MQKVFLMIILMINGPYGFYLLIGHDPGQCLVVLSDAIKNIAIYKSWEIFPDVMKNVICSELLS